MPEVTFTTRGALGKSALRRANERLVLNALRQQPHLSRADLVRMTGLSPSSMTFIVNRLLRERMLQEVRSGSAQNQVGRQPTPLRLRPQARYVIALELRKAMTRLVLADWTGEVIQARRVSAHTSERIYLERVHEAIGSLFDSVAAERVLGVGVATPGTVDRTTGRIVAAENLGWYGLDLRRALARDLPVELFVENEAKLCAQAELWSSHGKKPLRNFVFVTANEGIGTGVVIDGKLLHGSSGAAAEFGHVVLYPDGLECPCGNRGCWEQYASGAALVRLCSGMDVSTPDDVIAEARTGNKQAQSAVAAVTNALGIGFGNLLFTLNPEAIIVGDYIARNWDLLEEPVWRVIRERVPAYYQTGLKICPSLHAEDAPLRGAEALVLSNFFTSFDSHLQRRLTSESIANIYSN